MKLPDRKVVSKFVMQNAIYFVLALLIIVITIQEPSFLSLNNFRNILLMSSTRR